MEQQGEYVTQQEIDDASEMMGWKEPAVVIERPRTVAERQPNGQFVDKTIPAYVKFSTSFKAELKNITGTELRVWTYIALSINEEGIAFPGIRTIAEALGISHQTVITAVEGLEKKNFLHVVREGRKHNIYQPADEYVAIFDKNPTGPKTGTVQKLDSSPLDSNKIDEEENDLAKISRAYESEIGLITSMIADEMQEASTSYPLKWVLDAIHEAAVQNKRSWKYCLAILKRWKAQGNQSPANKKPAEAPHVPDMNDIERILNGTPAALA